LPSVRGIRGLALIESVIAWASASYIAGRMLLWSLSVPPSRALLCLYTRIFWARGTSRNVIIHGPSALQRSGRRPVPPAHNGGRSPCVLDRRLRKSRAHIGTERLRVGLRRADFVPARDADNGRDVRTLAAGLISNALFAAGVAAVVLVLLGGTTWVVVVSLVLLTRSPATRAAW
jgi:hypothetical protein